MEVFKKIIGYIVGLVIVLLIWEYGYRILVFLTMLPVMLFSMFINITIPWFTNLFG